MKRASMTASDCVVSTIIALNNVNNAFCCNCLSPILVHAPCCIPYFKRIIDSSDGVTFLVLIGISLLSRLLGLLLDGLLGTLSS